MKMTLKNKIKFELNKIFNFIGYELVPKDMFYFNSEDRIDTIIDVGVYEGTEILQKNFPHAFYHYIEPNPKSIEFIKSNLLEKFKGKVHQYAASNIEEDVWFSDIADESTVCQESEDNKFKVKLKKLDRILEGEEISKSTLLKIDVEGYELDVLNGSSEILQKCALVIIELRISGDKLINKPSSVINLMTQSGFEIIGICGEGRRSTGTHFIDLVFKRS